MRNIPDDIPGHVQLRISSEQLSHEVIRSRLRSLPLQEDGHDLVLALPSETGGLNCQLITMWETVQHEKHNLKSLSSENADLRIICFISNAMPTLRLEPDALLLSSKLSIPIEINTRRKSGQHRTKD